jgi:23S rRNA (adenine2030-N6)-methyltransferase
MNYRHIYHAGNFADVLKHAVLGRIISYTRQKPAPFRFIDTHAGIGIYDLGSEPASKTAEWQGGIGRLMGPAAEPLPEPVEQLLAPYLDVVEAVNQDRAQVRYPGSPEIARRMLRRDDILVLNELHPDDHGELARRYAIYTNARVLQLDAFVALKALLPPPERRGLILIDPPYEAVDELSRLARGLGEALKRFATGTFLVWYPVKDLAPVETFHASLAPLGLAKTLRMDLYTRAPDTAHRLNGCGLLAINPPWTLETEMTVLLPFLAERLANGPGSGWRLTS